MFAPRFIATASRLCSTARAPQATLDTALLPRAPALSALPAMARPPAGGLQVATFNLRNETDRYSERRELLGRAFVELGASLCGLQEVTFGDAGQTAFLAECARAAAAVHGDAAGVEHKFLEGWLPKTYLPADPASNPHFRIDGNAIFAGHGLQVLRHEVLVLTDLRVAHRALVRVPRAMLRPAASDELPSRVVEVPVAAVDMYDDDDDADGPAAAPSPSADELPALTSLVHGAAAAELAGEDGVLLWFVNTHLHHVVVDTDVRCEQVRKVCEWMRAVQDEAAHCIIVGDCNAVPTEAAYAEFEAQGFASAYKQVHGAEPELTFPSGLKAPTMDLEGPACLDYVWLSPGLRAVRARVAANECLLHDPTIFPSDHLAVVAAVVEAASPTAGRP